MSARDIVWPARDLGRWFRRVREGKDERLVPVWLSAPQIVDRCCALAGEIPGPVSVRVRRL